MKSKLNVLSVTIVALLICFQNLYGQRVNTSKKDLAEAKSMIFYGFDFGHFKIKDSNIHLEGNAKKFILSWFGYVTDQISEVEFANRFNKDTVKFRFDYMVSLVKSLNEDDLITVMKNTLSADSIQSFIDSYQLKEKEGIGFVVVPECFDKAKPWCSAYFVFFDIATKKILLSNYFGTDEAHVRMTSKSGYGITFYWGNCLHLTLLKYIKTVYRRELRKT